MARTPFNIAQAIDNLVCYGKDKLKLSDVDAIYAKNQLLALFKVDEPEEGNYKPSLSLQEQMLDPLINYAIREEFIDKSEALLFETKIMGLLLKSPGQVVAEFDDIAAHFGIEKATDYLNEISVNSNYIRMADIKKNIRWTAPGDMGNLTITINLSKPEKDNKQVAREKAMPQNKYPMCMLCADNLGYNGNARHPARQTLRIIPIPICGESWYIQFSPYVYYDNHCIAFSAEHRPMAVSDKTFPRLFDFVEMFPHYFIGSNADLPIVGGSILAHDHYQGGKKVLPMLKSGNRAIFYSKDYPEVKFSILDWYNSVIKLNSKNRGACEKAAASILKLWRGYDDPENEILSYTDAIHNTITPIATYTADEGYSLYLILRNNRTDEKRPDGIFHPTADMHNIKKEGIGLIEAMGTFILPGRLYGETRSIIEILCGEKPLDFKELSLDTNPLSKHLNMIAQLTNDYGTALSAEKAETAVVDYINTTCIKILNCTAVFKNTEAGQQGFETFLNACNIIKA